MVIRSRTDILSFALLHPSHRFFSRKIKYIRSDFYPRVRERVRTNRRLDITNCCSVIAHFVNNQPKVPPVHSSRICSRYLSYTQGQSPSPGTREYFYYIDHHGQLFLDDTKIKNFVTCFKDKQFLVFFLRRMKTNKTDRYTDEFPFISPCGKEMNFIRCEDKPVVFSHILDDPDKSNSAGVLSYTGTGGKLVYPFQPEKICMLPQSGRVYHPGPEKLGGVALIKSSLAIELSNKFMYAKGNQELDPPTHFVWNEKEYKLDNSLWELMNSEECNQLKNALN